MAAPRIKVPATSIADSDSPFRELTVLRERSEIDDRDRQRKLWGCLAVERRGGSGSHRTAVIIGELFHGQPGGQRHSQVAGALNSASFPEPSRSDPG